MPPGLDSGLFCGPGPHGAVALRTGVVGRVAGERCRHVARQRAQSPEMIMPPGPTRGRCRCRGRAIDGVPAPLLLVRMLAARSTASVLSGPSLSPWRPCISRACRSVVLQVFRAAKIFCLKLFGFHRQVLGLFCEWLCIDGQRNNERNLRQPNSDRHYVLEHIQAHIGDPNWVALCFVRCSADRQRATIRKQTQPLLVRGQPSPM
jgi:hypothetical protein